MARHRGYPRGRDPYWTKARFDGKCRYCSATIRKGDLIFYYPNTRSAFGEQCGCGETAAADFEAARQDEEAAGFGA